jgi:hypothetical protein
MLLKYWVMIVMRLNNSNKKHKMSVLKSNSTSYSNYGRVYEQHRSKYIQSFAT